MLEVLVDALIDTLKLIPLLLIANVLIEVLEHAVVGRIRAEKALKGGFAPLIGAGVGLLPQCGFSVVAANMYSSRHIGMGTLLAVFVATSDEAVPILLSSPSSALRLLPLLAVKLAGALVIGYVVSLVLSRRDKKNIVEVSEEESFHAVGCHGHALVGETREHEGEHSHGGDCDGEDGEEDKLARKKADRKKLLDRFLWHPLLHTLTVSLYILAVNILLGVVIYFITEQRLAAFMSGVIFAAPCRRNSRTHSELRFVGCNSRTLRRGHAVARRRGCGAVRKCGARACRAVQGKQAHEGKLRNTCAVVCVRRGARDGDGSRDVRARFLGECDNFSARGQMP